MRDLRWCASCVTVREEGTERGVQAELGDLQIVGVCVCVCSRFTPSATNQPSNITLCSHTIHTLCARVDLTLFIPGAHTPVHPGPAAA